MHTACVQQGAAAHRWSEMDVCVEGSGAAVDWSPLLMTGMLIREIFIDPGDPETSGKRTRSRLLSGLNVYCRWNVKRPILDQLKLVFMYA